MKVAVISGHAQHGKDTSASIMKKKLEERGDRVLICHYADLLKYICKTFFDWNGEKDDEGRHLLQYIGTDVIRASNPNFWVDFICSVLELFKDKWDWVLIPDTRFPNEIDRLKENNFEVVHYRVKRVNFESFLPKNQQNHPSETALDTVKPDFYIINRGSLEDLEEEINTLIKEGLYGTN